jgi:hypothetical protein
VWQEVAWQNELDKVNLQTFQTCHPELDSGSVFYTHSKVINRILSYAWQEAAY